MTTASFISIPATSSDLETPIVQPLQRRSDPASCDSSAKWGTEALADAADLEESESLKSRLAIDPAMKASRLRLDDVCNLLLLLVLGAAAVSVPGLMFMKMFSAAAEFSSLDIMRMMAGMP